EHVVGEIEVERPTQADHGKLEQYEPQTARQKKPRELAAVVHALPGEERGSPRGKHGRGRDERRDPTREEDTGRRAAGRESRIHANVIDRHEHDDHATNDVERSNTLFGRSW